MFSLWLLHVKERLTCVLVDLMLVEFLIYLSLAIRVYFNLSLAIYLYIFLITRNRNFFRNKIYFLITGKFILSHLVLGNRFLKITLKKNSCSLRCQKQTLLVFSTYSDTEAVTPRNKICLIIQNSIMFPQGQEM